MNFSELSDLSDTLRTKEIATIFHTLEWLERTGSTNSDLAERAMAGEPEGIVLVADYQTDGRGTRGRKWEAPAGSALLFSMLLRPSCAYDKLPLLTQMAALSVADVCEEVTGKPAKLKWPNDVLMDSKKVAGILAEIVETGTPDTDTTQANPTHRGDTEAGDTPTPAVVLGIGLNITWPTTNSPTPGFLSPATSLKSIAPHANLDRADILKKLLENFHNRYSTLSSPTWNTTQTKEVNRRTQKPAPHPT